MMTLAGLLTRSKRVLALLAVVSLGVAPATALSSTRTTAGPGCLPGQLAVAHYSGGLPLRRQPQSRPVPCGTPTGYASGETPIAVTNSGTVFQFPAVSPAAGAAALQTIFGVHAAFARSTDTGRSWHLVQPLATNVAGTPGYPFWEQSDSRAYLDRDTGRLFWTDAQSLGGLTAVVWTDDDGLSWGNSFATLGPEWTEVSTAKPRTSTPTDYPKVVYACGEGTSASTTEVPSAPAVYLCQKSLDGGQTWITAGQGFIVSPAAPHPQCAGQSEYPNFSPRAVPDPQGRLYELVNCAGRTFLARSRDEGATWPILARLPFTLRESAGETYAEMRSDALGNLYLAWSSVAPPFQQHPYKPGQVYLSISRDEGRTWAAPLETLAPGVDGIRTAFGFDVGAPGDVELSYLGHRKGRSGFDGYITMTRDALAARPLLWSAVATDLSQPPLDLGDQGSSDGLGLDYVGAAIGPDGTPWASFWDACHEDLPQPAPAACPADRRSPAGVTSYGYGGFVGRLNFPSHT